MFSSPIEQFHQSFDHSDPKRATASTIVSALDELVLTQESPPPEGSVYVSPDKHLTVYADRVVIRGPVNLPGRRIDIVARELAATKDGGGRAPQLNVGGGPPTAPTAPNPQRSRANDGGDPRGDRPTGEHGSDGAAGADGAAGSTGTDGGMISVRIEHFVRGTQLRLIANGGNGGNAQAGQVGQDAGHGGKGRNGTRRPRWNIPGEKGTSGGNGGAGGRGGTGGNGGLGGKGGDISVVVVHNEANVSLAFAAIGGAGGEGANGARGGNGGNGGTTGDRAGNSPNAKPGAGGVGGSSGLAGNGGAGGVCEIIERFEILVDVSFSGGTGGRPGRPDRGGQGGIGPGSTKGAEGEWPSVHRLKPGASGPNGRLGRRKSLAYSEFANLLPASLLAMLLQKVKLLQLTIDPIADRAGMEQLVTYLRWVQQVTGPLTPERKPVGFPPEKVAAFTAIYGQAAAIAFQLMLKHDAFGHAPSYVPQGSYNFYDRLLNSMIGPNGTFTAIERAHQTYFKAVEQKKATLAQLADARASGEQQLATLHQQRDEVLLAVKNLVPAIDDAQAAIEHQYGIMKAALAGLEQDLALIAGANCMFENLVKGLNLVHSLSDSKDVELAASIAGHGEKAFVFGLTKIGGMDGIPDSKIVQRVGVLGRDVKTLRDGFDASRGIITQDDPDAYKLITARSEFETLISPYLSLPSAAKARETMEIYVTLVQRRNADVMRFNTAVGEFAAAAAAVQQGEGELAAVGSVLAAKSDPALPGLMAFVGRLYHEAREQVIEALYLASRSFAFWSLQSDYSAFRTFVGLTNPSGITSATLAAATQKLRTSLAQAIEDFGTGPQEFPAKGKTGISVHFSEVQNGGLLALFKRPNENRLHQVSVSLPAAMPGTSQVASPFFGLANIRLHKVRAWVHGATTADGVLDVVVRHGGEETIVDTRGIPHVFTHAPITKSFRFENGRVGDAAAIVLDGDFDASGKSAAYAQPGPFTTWTITVMPDHNTGLNLEAVTGLTLEFFGNAYTFPSRKARAKTKGGKPVKKKVAKKKPAKKGAAKKKSVKTKRTKKTRARRSAHR
jgi:hypothetical protein